MKQHFVRGAAWAGAASWIEQALNLIIFVIIARIIGTEEFGLATMVLAFILIGEVLVRETLTEGVIERHSLEAGFLEATFAALMGLGLLIFLALSTLSPGAALLYGVPSVEALMVAVSPVVLLIAIGGVPTAILRRNMAFKTLAIRAVAGVLVGGVVGIYLAMEGYGAWSLIFRRLASTSVNSIIAIVAAGWWPKKMPSRKDFAGIGMLGPRIVLLRATALVMLQTPTIVLGATIGQHAVAIFALTWRFVEVILALIVVPIKSVGQSTIAAMRRKGDRTDDFLIEVTQIIALAGFAAYAGLALIGDPAVELVFGPDWNDTIYVLPWICLVGAVQALTAFQESYLMAHNRTRRYVRVVIAEAIVCILLIYVASSYGAVYAAAAFALRAILFFPLRSWIALSPEQISGKRYVEALMPPVAIALGMAISVEIWRRMMLDQIPDVYYLISVIIIGILVFGGILIFLAPSVFQRVMTFVQSAKQKEG